MITIDRHDLKKFFPHLITQIQEHHNMDAGVGHELFVKNKAVKGLCHTRGYFVIIEDDIYLQYVMEHTVVEPDLCLIARTLRLVVLYDNYTEYECDRVRQLGSVNPDQQNGLHLN